MPVEAATFLHTKMPTGDFQRLNSMPAAKVLLEGGKIHLKLKLSCQLIRRKQ